MEPHLEALLHYFRRAIRYIQYTVSGRVVTVQGVVGRSRRRALLRHSQANVPTAC